MKIFVDSSGWIELVNPGLPLHQAVTTVFGRHLDNGDKFFTHNVALGLATSEIRRQWGIPLAGRFAEIVEEASVGAHLRVLWIGRKTQKDATHLMRKHPDILLDYFDFATFSLMEKRHIQTIITTRSAFRALGLKVVPEFRE